MMQDTFIGAKEKYKRHPSILKIRIENYFDFKHTDDENIAVVLKDLNAKKADDDDKLFLWYGWPIKGV